MERDLHTLLTSVRDDAPPPRLSVDDITAAGRHLVRRRRRIALLSSVSGGAVAAVAAVTAALMLSAPGGLVPAVDPSGLPAAAATPVPSVFAEEAAFFSTYKGYEAGQYTISAPEVATAFYQQSSIDAGIDLAPPLPSPTVFPEKSRVPGLTTGGSLVVYRRGAFDPIEFKRSAEEVRVRTAVGLLHYAGGGSSNPSTPTDRTLLQKQEPRVPTLAWQYADDAWAAIYWTSWDTVPTSDELIQIADGLRPAAPTPFPVGFEAGNVPKGYRLLSVSFGSDQPTGYRFVSSVRLAPMKTEGPILGPADVEDYPSLLLGFGRTDPQPKRAGKLDCANGSQVCTKIMEDGQTYVQAESVGLKFTSQQLAQIVLGLKVHDPNDMAGWPPAAKIFP